VRYPKSGRAKITALSGLIACSRLRLRQSRSIPIELRGPIPMTSTHPQPNIP